MRPKFSIIIPLYNKSAFIQATLNSVQQQEYSLYEVIVIDDGSTDDSLEKVQKYTGISLRIFSQKNQGVSVARNVGVKKAIGEYIVFLDADDLWYPNHLSQFIESISLFPNQKIFCNNYEIALGKGVTKETHFSILFDETPYLVTNFFRASLKNSIAWTSAICIERELFEDHKFDEEIRSGQDTDLWIVLGLKFPFVFHKNVSAIHRKWIVNSLSKTKNINSRKLILDKYSSFQYNDAHFEHYLNQLRFSLWLQAKCDEQLVIAQQLQSNLLVKYLSFKQKIVLRCSPKQLRQLLFIKKSIRYCVYYLTYVKKGMCL